jgi:hypothetical protein
MLVVYLDQNFWIRLSAARQARLDPGFTELLTACERAVDDGRAQFVLSWANYEENWRRGSLSDRCQVAETMERLTAFTTMRTIWRLHEDEVRESLSSFLPVQAQERPPMFGRGIRHLLPFEPFDLFSADFRTRLASEEALHRVADVLVERAALIGSMFEGNHVDFRRPDREHHEAYIERRTELATNLRAAGNSADLARRLVLAAEIVDISSTISRIAAELGYSVEPTSREGIESFLDSLPMGSIVTALHLSAIRDGRAWTRNDYNDVLYLSAASAYCDVVAGERHLTSKLNHPTVPTQSRNVSTARELVAILEATRP